MEADWSEIPTDLLPLIGSKINLYEDRFRFRSVSKSWRTSYTIPIPIPPWLILSEANIYEKHYAVESRRKRNTPVPLRPRGIVGFAEQEIFKLDLPEAHERQIVGSTGTLLITIGKDGMIHLLDPFTRSQIQLPSVKTFSNYDPERYKKGRVLRNFAEKIILSSSSSTRDCIAMALHGYCLSFARPGDSSWTRCPTPEESIGDIVFYKEKFYIVINFGGLMICDTVTRDNQSSFTIVMPPFELDYDDDDDGYNIYSSSEIEIYRIDHNSFERFYLVEWMGELLMVIKIVDKTQLHLEKTKRSEETVLYKDFKIFKLDFSNSKWDELKNLGEYSLFLGRNTSVSILASYHEGIRKNCIYFTDDCMNLARSGDLSCGRDMGVFDMEKKDIQPLLELVRFRSAVCEDWEEGLEKTIMEAQRIFS